MPNKHTYYHFRRPQDWSLLCGGSGLIYGWGHNHRGQLGGVDGAKVKIPMSCDSLAALKPMQIVGGEQTLFCVTSDGKVPANKCLILCFSY